MERREKTGAPYQTKMGLAGEGKPTRAQTPSKQLAFSGHKKSFTGLESPLRHHRKSKKESGV